MPLFHLGIDIAKQTFDAALLTTDKTPKYKSFENTEIGFHALVAWLKVQFVSDLSDIHACMESTAYYGDALARFLVANDATVSVVNPASLRAFAKTELSRAKTDKADAIRIARYCKLHEPKPWIPPVESESILLALVRRLETLKNMHVMEKNRLEGSSLAVRSSLEAVLNFLDEQISSVEKQIRDHIRKHPDLKIKSDLLTSIPGIGEATAAVLLAEFGDITRFGSAKKAAAFVGLVPRLCESGTSVRGRSVLCKMGSGFVRKALYFPALSAVRHNLVIRTMYERLVSAGKAKKSALGAAMRRLVHLAFGVLKSGKPFDPQIAMAKA